MAGHSKWANIKHRKGAQDAKRSKVWSKIGKELMVAAKLGGGDVDSNPRLRGAVAEARAANMPKDNIKRAIQRGTGEVEGAIYEDVTYEGYGPGGVAILIEALTDNRNRTVAEVRSTLSKNGGNMGESGSVAWMFEKKGLIAVTKEGVSEDSLMDLVLDAGAEDLREEGGIFEVVTPPAEFANVKDRVDQEGLKVESAELTALPKNSIELKGDAAVQMLKLMEVIEDLDDVQKVYANFDIDDAELEEVLNAK